MNVKTHHLAASLIAGAMFLSALTWFSVNSPSAIATCGIGANIAITTPSAAASINGNYSLTASSPSSTTVPTGVTFVISAPATQVIGQGTVTTNQAYPAWSYGWDTTTFANGNYSISAIAHYSTGTSSDCTSSPVTIMIANPVQASSPSNQQLPKLSVSIKPNSWNATPGLQGQFTVSGTYTDQNGVQAPVSTSSGATINWFSSTGTILPNGQMTTLTAGSTVGNFILGAIVTMNGVLSEASAAIKVDIPPSTSKGSSALKPAAKLTPTPPSPPSSTSSHGPSPTPLAGSSTSADPVAAALTPQQIEILTTTPTVFRPPAATNSRPIVAITTLACLENKLGLRYSAISSGIDDANVAERLSGSKCFSGSDRIPASLAPVEPTQLSQVPTTTSIVTLSGANNETITNNKGDKVAAILIGGTGAPNSDVFVYIFSDPMVLRAQTDKTGRWNYVLQNPLKPGHHEIYAVAAKDSNSFVRTSAIPVSIAAAAAGSQDGSLVIESALKPAQVTYIVAAILMVMVAMFLLFRMRRVAKHQVSDGVMVNPGSGPAPAVVHPTDATMHAMPAVITADPTPQVLTDPVVPIDPLVPTPPAPPVTPPTQ